MLRYVRVQLGQDPVSVGWGHGEDLPRLVRVRVRVRDRDRVRGRVRDRVRDRVRVGVRIWRASSGVATSRPMALAASTTCFTRS